MIKHNLSDYYKVDTDANRFKLSIASALECDPRMFDTEDDNNITLYRITDFEQYLKKVNNILISLFGKILVPVRQQPSNTIVFTVTANNLNTNNTAFALKVNENFVYPIGFQKLDMSFEHYYVFADILIDSNPYTIEPIVHIQDMYSIPATLTYGVSVDAIMEGLDDEIEETVFRVVGHNIRTYIESQGFNLERKDMMNHTLVSSDGEVLLEMNQMTKYAPFVAYKWLKDNGYVG